MENIAALNETLDNEHVRGFREAGGAVVGFACVFTPVELLDAAGIMPYRIKGLGHTETDLADGRMSRFNCRFCRVCLQQGLRGDYDFLDGVLESNGCDQLRGMFENWQYAHTPAFFHYLKAPHQINADALDHFTLELGRLRAAIQEHFEVEITDDGLRGAMALRQRIRQKLLALDRLRAQDRPALTGADALQVALVGGSLPAAVYEELLDELLERHAQRRLERPAVRLLMGGAASDEPTLFDAVEDFGALVVADTFCFGARSYRPLLTEQAGAPDPAEDPLAALAGIYLGGSRCPRMYAEFDGRLAYVREAVEEARADGVVLVNNKFCDLHGFDNTLLRMRLEEQGVPVLSLEKEYGSPADYGRMRTRVQAFLERIGGRR